MKCSDPVLCYTGTKRVYRNWSMATDIFKRIAQTVFRCNKCQYCRKNMARQLAARCVLHASLYDRNSFLTLTYDETLTTYHNNFEYEDVQLFKKRLRTHCQRTHQKRIQVYNVHEYGKKGKKHWHLIVFNHDFDDKTLYTIKNGIPLYTSTTLEKLWPYGFNTIGDVTEASAMYQSQYMEKDFQYNHAGTNKKCHSKHSGIGGPYFLKHYKQILSLGYVPVNNQKMPLPRYFEKLAHKHWSHFYQPDNFFDTLDRKALYRPFKKENPNKEIADLYISYKHSKDERIEQYSEEWEEFLSDHFENDTEADFVKSGQNALYDLKNRTNLERL